jgi:hypothetical protein
MSYADDEFGDHDNSVNDISLPFQPRDPDDYSDVSSLSTNRKKQLKYKDELKNIDRGYHKLKRNLNNKRVYIEIYTTSNSPGTMIRDAVTGARYSEFRVGTLNEHLFFKVTVSTGELGTNKGTLYYDSPEQFERHFKGSSLVSQQTKEKWTNKCAEIRILNSK